MMKFLASVNVSCNFGAVQEFLPNILCSKKPTEETEIEKNWGIHAHMNNIFRVIAFCTVFI